MSDKSKSGYILVTVLLVSLMLTSVAILTYSVTSLSMDIARNDRLIRRARINAQSGVTNFVAKRLHYEDVSQFLYINGDKPVVEGVLSKKDKYSVFVQLRNHDMFEITSRGIVLKEGKILASHDTKALFKSVWVIQKK